MNIKFFKTTTAKIILLFLVATGLFFLSGVGKEVNAQTCRAIDTVGRVGFFPPLPLVLMVYQ